MSPSEDRDTSADKLMIKFNSDNKDGFAIENEHKPEVEFVKVDKDDTNKKLSGAVFEIWSAKESGEWTVEPDVKLGTYTTDANGHFIANLDYGIYFWREVQAPAGYAPEDYDYHSFRVIKGVPQYQFVIANKPGTPPPYEPGGPTYQIELKKVDKETRESLAGAEFELWSAKLAEDGIRLIPDAKLVTKNLVTGQYGIARVTVSHKGKFFYREVKAPTGYEADANFHLIDTSTTVDLITRVEVENEKLQKKRKNQRSRIVQPNRTNLHSLINRKKRRRYRRREILCQRGCLYCFWHPDLDCLSRQKVKQQGREKISAALVILRWHKKK